MYSFKNLNEALLGMSMELLDNGVWEETRGFRCKKLPHPILICIEDIRDRHVTLPERKWNKILPFVESLWIALGLNDLDVLPGNYVKKLYDFSDNGRTWRAGYGSRLRYFSGHENDYDISNCRHAKIYSGGVNFTDQLKYVVDVLFKDINSRQAGITIHDPAKDDFYGNGNLKITKDQPCTRTIHFQMNEGKLDCTVTMRSNDILWGFSAINVFNFTFMQEYVASILDVPVGKYYHFVNNFHVYENFIPKLELIINNNVLYRPKSYDFKYEDSLYTLDNFDTLINKLFKYEQQLRIDQDYGFPPFTNDMFYDWGLVFYNYHTNGGFKFKNPYLNDLFYGNN